MIKSEDPLQYRRRNRHGVDSRESDIIDVSCLQSSGGSYATSINSSVYSNKSVIVLRLTLVLIPTVM